MDWNAVTGIATVVTAFAAIGSTWAAIFAVKRQNENFERSNQGFRLSLSADLALKLDGTFNSNAFRKSRAVAAKSLLRQEEMVESEEVLDFFETIGLFMKSGALNEEIAYSFSSTGLICIGMPRRSISRQAEGKTTRCGKILSMPTRRLQPSNEGRIRLLQTWSCLPTA